MEPGLTPHVLCRQLAPLDLLFTEQIICTRITTQPPRRKQLRDISEGQEFSSKATGQPLTFLSFFLHLFVHYKVCVCAHRRMEA